MSSVVNVHVISYNLSDLIVSELRIVRLPSTIIGVCMFEIVHWLNILNMVLNSLFQWDIETRAPEHWGGIRGKKLSLFED